MFSSHLSKKKGYSDNIPEVKGDYAEYWADGQGTDARSAGNYCC